MAISPGLAHRPINSWSTHGHTVKSLLRSEWAAAAMLHSALLLSPLQQSLFSVQSMENTNRCMLWAAEQCCIKSTTMPGENIGCSRKRMGKGINYAIA